jgi:hypothetical protein
MAGPAAFWNGSTSNSHEKFSGDKEPSSAQPPSPAWNCPEATSWGSEELESWDLEEMEMGDRIPEPLRTSLTDQPKWSFPTTQDGSSATVATENPKTMGLAAGGKLGAFQFHCSLSNSVLLLACG